MSFLFNFTLYDPEFLSNCVYVLSELVKRPITFMIVIAFVAMLRMPESRDRTACIGMMVLLTIIVTGVILFGCFPILATVMLWACIATLVVVAILLFRLERDAFDDIDDDNGTVLED